MERDRYGLDSPLAIRLVFCSASQSLAYHLLKSEKWISLGNCSMGRLLSPRWLGTSDLPPHSPLYGNKVTAIIKKHQSERASHNLIAFVINVTLS